MEKQDVAPSYQPGELLLGANSVYELAPDGEVLKFHIADVRKGTGKNFDTGEPEPRVMVVTVLDDEVPGHGQKFSLYLKDSMHEKSIMFKFLKAVYGKVQPVDAADLIGRPFQATLKNKTKDDGSVRQNFDAFLKPAADQKVVEIKHESAPVEAGISDADLDAALDAAFNG